jgi:hypothetical protein
MNDSPECLPEDDRARLDTYLNLVEARIFPALASDAVQNSCSATLLLEEVWDAQGGMARDEIVTVNGCVLIDGSGP